MQTEVLSSTPVREQGDHGHGPVASKWSAGIPFDGFVVHALETRAQLVELHSSWQELAVGVSEPNPFYESLFFLSSLDMLPPGNWRVVTVWQQEKSGNASRLIGLFPLVRRRGIGPIPLSCWSLACHDYCFLTTPLLARGAERACLEVLLKYLDQETRLGVLELPLLGTGGPVYEALVDVVRDRQLTTFCVDEYNRACLRRSSPDVESFQQRAIGGHTLRELRRGYRRLGDLGSLEYRAMTPEVADLWTDWFLDLEASGWKGAQGTALKDRSCDREFFRNLVCEGARQGTTEMLGLFLNGEPIALKCNLIRGAGSFAFKIAYRESYSKQSPGVQLELENIRRFWERQQSDWMDSCASPRHFMINRLWPDRRPIQHLLISTGRTSCDLLLASLPLLRSVNRILNRTRSRVGKLWGNHSSEGRVSPPTEDRNH